LRDDARDDDRLDVGTRDLRLVEQRGEQDAVLVRGPPRVGRDPPRSDELPDPALRAAREIAELRVRIVCVNS
jgi:hypothetical protein